MTDKAKTTKATIKDFLAWMERDLGCRASIVDHAEYVSYGGSGDGDWANDLNIRIFTSTNRYLIHAKERSVDDGYLGCQATTRKPRAGEDWHRGNDLSDGPLCEETWHAILADIVGYEMVKVHHRQLGTSGVYGHLFSEAPKQTTPPVPIHRNTGPQKAIP